MGGGGVYSYIRVLPDESTENSSRCQLCNGVQDQRHCKNLFDKTNEKMLNNVELIHGEKLPHVDGYFSLFLDCRPNISTEIEWTSHLCHSRASIHPKKCVWGGGGGGGVDGLVLQVRKIRWYATRNFFKC